MNQNTVVGIIVAAIVIIGGYMLFQSQGPSTVVPSNTNVSLTNNNATGSGETNATTSHESTSAFETSSTSSIQQTSTTTNSPATSTIVTYTDKGFVPATVTIQAGEKVTWRNESSSGMWTASNPHPEHTDYPGFDARTSLTKGATYSFVFTKKGAWGYHNHLNPAMKGIVIVK